MKDDNQQTPEKPAEEEHEPKKASAQILQHEVEEGIQALERSTRRLIFSGLSAGLDIGFSLFLIGIVATLFEGKLEGPTYQILRAMMYSFGYLIVIIGRSELFTEQTSLAVLPLLSGKTTFRKVARLWGIVYISNIIGAACFAGILVIVGPALGVIDRKVFGEFSAEAVHHAWWVVLLSGILAGWLMGLLSWLIAAGRDTIGQVVIILLVTTTIGLGHLHHCILGTVKVLAGVFAGSSTTLADFGHFLLWATLGNAVGGPFFIFFKYGMSQPKELN